MILVDQLRPYETGTRAALQRSFRGKPPAMWCHLVSDASEAELHDFAAAIGMRREWFQRGATGLDHYDLTPARRTAALRAGAVEVGSKELVRRHYNRASDNAR